MKITDSQIEEEFDMLVSYIASFIEDEKIANETIEMARRHGRLMYQLGYQDAKRGFNKRYLANIKEQVKE